LSTDNGKTSQRNRDEIYMRYKHLSWPSFLLSLLSAQFGPFGPFDQIPIERQDQKSGWRCTENWNLLPPLWTIDLRITLGECIGRDRGSVIGEYKRGLHRKLLTHKQRLFTHVPLRFDFSGGFAGAFNGPDIAACPRKHGFRAPAGRRCWHKCWRGADSGRGSNSYHYSYTATPPFLKAQMMEVEDTKVDAQ